MNQKIIKHFQNVDPTLFRAFEKLGRIEGITVREVEDYFTALSREIINQQLSDKVANIIFERFLNLFPKKKPTPEFAVKLEDQKLRHIGTSWAKVRYIKDLAQKIASKEVHFEKLKEMEDEEAISELIKIKGIGRWTGEMFLMFALGREDIFSYRDLGLRNAIKKLYKIENLTQEKAEEISIKWSPYRTYACRILWESLVYNECKDQNANIKT